jgi:hypothetical protein
MKEEVERMLSLAFYAVDDDPVSWPLLDEDYRPPMYH